MAKSRDKNFVSIWFWLIAMLVIAIPLVNIIMIIIWAFVGENESRKNYFKATIILFLLAIAFVLLIFSLGFLPPIIDELRRLKK